VTSEELIGRVGAEFLALQIGTADEPGTARFLLDRLTGTHVTAICRVVLTRVDLAPRVRLRIPRALGEPNGLPSDALTDDKTTHWRHSECDRPVLLLANTDDDQGQSLQEITRVGARELVRKPSLWVDVAAAGLALPPAHATIWKTALKGLTETHPLSLEEFAGYVLMTRESISSYGRGIPEALGWALPALRAPRDSSFFNAIPEKVRTQASRWSRLFSQVIHKRACYLMKRAPNQQVLSIEQLLENWQRVADAVPTEHHPTVEAFLRAPARWVAESEALAQLDWERDNIKALFDGLKRRAETQPLGKATLEFFDEQFPAELTEEEESYLRRLDQRKALERNPDDEDFYERHRGELDSRRALKTRWDRFIHGQPIESADFGVGLLRCLERLFEQAGPAPGTRKLKIEVTRRSPKAYLDMNYEAISYFCHRYRGLYSLTRGIVDWQVGSLFSFDTLAHEREQRGVYDRQAAQSNRLADNQIKFYLTLDCAADTYSAQLIWHFNPRGVSAEFGEDWRKLLNDPFLVHAVTREAVSAKGRLQSVDLADVGTLMPLGRQDRGSLVGPPDAERDLALRIETEIDRALEEHRTSSGGHGELKGAWQRFRKAYTVALREAFETGFAAESCLGIEKPYGELLESLSRHAPGDRNRKLMWEPVLSVGVVPVEAGPPAAIVGPWHPLRLIGVCVKTRQLAGLVHHLLTAESIDLGDRRLFFQDLAHELAHAYYPEVCLGFEGAQPVLLAVTDTYGDYTLMEPAVHRASEDDSTDDNPTTAAREIVSVVKRYLDLQPHETANLSVVLYNCNSVRLPEATVNALGDLYEEGETVRCQVILRHNSPARLRDLYERILETTESDPDSLVASEASRDFMARLRISIMAAAAPVVETPDSRPTDIVFLQDVIARMAEQTWVAEPEGGHVPALLDHCPARSSRRRPGSADDLRAVAYLACPIQPAVGWQYLHALYGLLRGLEPTPMTRPLPARQISFQHNATRAIFDEVHRLGQWVVNSDDLLTRRQLQNQGVRIIRHRQPRHGDRSLTVSSTAPLNLLDVLVHARLERLNLPLDADGLHQLTRRMVDDATDISGDIVLRAAKRGEGASELIGLVLSRFLLQDELGTAQHCGWYFLDDYAGWLGQREEHLADILALSPQREGNEIVLVVLVGESKYVARAALSGVQKTSLVQMKETLGRLEEALFGSPARMDRDLWLSRLADMTIEGIQVPAAAAPTFHEWRDAIRNGAARILLKGYSHVFVHSEEDDPSVRLAVPKARLAWQEIYGRARLRELVLAYYRRESPRAVRGGLGDDRPWEEGRPEPVSGRVKWAVDSGLAAATPPLETSAPVQALPPTPPPQPTGASPASTLAPTPLKGEFAWAGPRLGDTLRLLATQTPTSTEDERWAQQTERQLRTALVGYGLQAQLIGRRITPNAVLVRFQGSDSLRTSDVERRREEILTTHKLHITNVLPEPGEVVISIARPNRQTIGLVEVWRRRELLRREPRSNQTLIVGVREADGEILVLNPGGEHAPHTLIAGTTGSGKSVLLQNLLLDIAATNDTSESRIFLIDPKQGIDFHILQDLPHIRDGIITSQEAAHGVLAGLISEMDRRNRLLREAGAFNLAAYNAKVPSDRREPVIWVFHDEFAAWMLDDEYKAAVSNTTQRLGVMARAAGIFLFFAAQRPEDKVMPLQLRDNLGNRLILRVESPGTSKIALGQEGAERLLGKGHLAVRFPGEDRIVLAQVPILRPEEIDAVVRAIRADCKSG